MSTSSAWLHYIHCLYVSGCLGNRRDLKDPETDQSQIGWNGLFGHIVPPFLEAKLVREKSRSHGTIVAGRMSRLVATCERNVYLSGPSTTVLHRPCPVPHRCQKTKRLPAWTGWTAVALDCGRSPQARFAVPDLLLTMYPGCVIYYIFLVQLFPVPLGDGNVLEAWVKAMRYHYVQVITSADLTTAAPQSPPCPARSSRIYTSLATLKGFWKSRSSSSSSHSSQNNLNSARLGVFNLSRWNEIL